MLGYLSRFSHLKRAPLFGSLRLFATPRLLELQTKIQSTQFQSAELPSILGDLKAAVAESKPDLTQFKVPSTLGKLIKQLNQSAESEAFNQMILLMNEVFYPAPPSHPQNDTVWKDLEETTLPCLKKLDAEALVNTLYYFIKMQQASSTFVAALQEALSNVDLSAMQASKTLLAVVMSGQINKTLVQKLIEAIEGDIESLDQKYIFQVVMAIPHPHFQPYHTPHFMDKLQKKCLMHLGEFDLLQLSQVMAAFQTTILPDLMAAFETQIKEALTNFNKYKHKIKARDFLGDLVRNLGSAAYCLTPASPSFWKQAESVITQNISNVPDEAMEMVAVAFLRSGSQVKPAFASLVVEEVLRRNLIRDKKVNELSILTFLTEYRLDSQKAYFELLGNVVEELKKGTELNVPLDILAIVAFSFARRFGPSQEPRVAELYKLLEQHIEANNEQGSFPTVCNVLSFLGNAEIKNDNLKTKTQERLLQMDFKSIPFGSEQFLTLLSILIQGEMFNEKLWEQAYEAMEAQIDSFDRLQFIRLFVTCSQLGLARPELWVKVKARVSRELSTLSSQELLEMHNCVAIQELEIPGFWEKVKDLIHKEKALPLPEIVNLGWSINKISNKDPKFWKDYERYLKSNSENMSLVDSQNVLLAMGKNPLLSLEFWEFMRGKIKRRLEVESDVPGEVIESILKELNEQDKMENGPLIVELSSALKKVAKNN